MNRDLSRLVHARSDWFKSPAIAVAANGMRVRGHGESRRVRGGPRKVDLPREASPLRPSGRRSAGALRCCRRGSFPPTIHRASLKINFPGHGGSASRKPWLAPLFIKRSLLSSTLGMSRGERRGGRGAEGEIPSSFAVRLPGFEKGLKPKSCSAFCRRDPDVVSIFVCMFVSSGAGGERAVTYLRVWVAGLGRRSPLRLRNVR